MTNTAISTLIKTTIYLNLFLKKYLDLHDSNR